MMKNENNNKNGMKGVGQSPAGMSVRVRVEWEWRNLSVKEALEILRTRLEKSALDDYVHLEIEEVRE